MRGSYFELATSASSTPLVPHCTPPRTSPKHVCQPCCTPALLTLLLYVAPLLAQEGKISVLVTGATGRTGKLLYKYLKADPRPSRCCPA